MVNLDHPNGLAFSPDERVLYVSQTPEGGPGAPEITALDWHDGALHNRRRFAVVPEGLPDGFCVDCQGWLWSSSGAGVCVFDSGGHVLGLVPTPHTASIAPSIWCNAAYSSPAAARCGCWTCSDKSGYQHDSAAVRRTCPRLARRRISA